MTSILIVEGWFIVALALAAALFCWRNARKIIHASQVIRYMKVVICLTLAVVLTLGLSGVVDGTFSLALLLSSVASLLMSLIAREIAESPK